jgi:hypothetical protein
MSRLFITQREIDFINDTTKEIVKDVIGQKIYFYAISEVKSNVHGIYEEAPNKVFENPIEIGALVKYLPQEIRTNQFGSEEYYSIEVYIQKRDLIDKGIEIREGDFFSYGQTFFEVIQAPDSDTIYGEIEYMSFITITGKQARQGQFVTHLFGPTSEEYSDPDAVQKTFVQQRGFKRNKEGITGDKRALIEQGKVELPPAPAPAEVSPAGSPGTKGGSSFYDES